MLFVVRGLVSARRLPVKKQNHGNGRKDKRSKERPARKDRIRQEVHVLRVKHVQVSLKTNISQNEREGEKEREGETDS